MKYILLLLFWPALAYAQDPRPEVTTAVPADVFNYFAWAAGIIVVGLVAGIVALFRRQGMTGLSKEESEWLKWLQIAHDSKDSDGVYNWMVPRSWGTVITQVAICLKKQEEIVDVRKRLEQEQTERRQQVETLLREQKDIMQAALESTTRIGVALESSNNLQQRIERLLTER